MAYPLKTYKTDKGVYEIPEKESASFLKDFPNAMEVVSYKMGKDTFDIPVKETQGFLKDNPQAVPLKKKEQSDNGFPEPSDGGLNGTTSTTEIPTISQEQLDKQDDVIGKIQEADALANKVKVSTPFERGMGKTVATPDFESIAKSKEIHNQLKGMGYGDNDIEILTKTFSDLPPEAETTTVMREGGKVDTPYSKKSFLELYKTDPKAAVTKANAVKNYFDLKKAAGEGVAQEYNKLQNVNDPNKTINANIDNFNSLKEQQKQIVTKNLPKEQQGKALERIDENSDIILNDIFKDENNAKNYLIGKLKQDDATLKLANPTVMEADGKVDNDLSKFSLQSIADNLDPKNKAEKLAFRKYKYGVDLDNALNTSVDFNEAAMKFAAEQNPTIKGQMEKMGMQKLPNAYEGEIVNEFLNNPDVIKRAQENPEFQKQYELAKSNLYFNYPEFAKKEVATKISQGREDAGMNNWFANVPTKEGTDKLVDKMVQDGKMTEQDKLVYETQIKPELGVWQSVKRGVGRIPFGAFIDESPISTPGLLESAQNSFNKTIHGVAHSIEDIGGMATLGTVNKVNDKERLYNKLQEDASMAKLLPKSTLHEIAMGTGNLAGFVIPMMAGGAALSSVKGGEFIANALMFEGENKDNALKMFPDNPTKQFAYTALATAGDVMLGHLIPKGDAAKGIAKTLKGDIVDVVNKFTNKEITAAEAKQTLLNKATSVLGDLAKENTKVAGTITGFGAFHNTLDALFGGNDMSAGDIATQAVKDFKSNFLTTPLLAAMAVKGKASGINGKVLMEVADNPELYKKLITEQSALKPELKATEAERLQNLEDATSIKKDLDKTDMTDKQKQDYMVTAINKKILERKAAGVTDKTLKQSILDQAEKHDTNMVLLQSELGGKEFKDLTTEEKDRIEVPKGSAVKTQPSGTEGKFTPLIVNEKGEHEVLNRSFDTPEAAKIYGEETIKKRYFEENIKDKKEDTTTEELPNLSVPIEGTDKKGIPVGEDVPAENKPTDVQKGVVTIPVKIDGKEIDAKYLDEYKGHKIVEIDGDVYTYDPKKEILFKVALDDSKSTGSKKVIPEANNVETAKQYIDWKEGANKENKFVKPIEVKPTDVVVDEGVVGKVLPKPKGVDEKSAKESEKWISDLISLPDYTRIKDSDGNVYEVSNQKVSKLIFDKDGNVIDKEIVWNDKRKSDGTRKTSQFIPELFNQGYEILPKEQSPNSVPKWSDFKKEENKKGEVWNNKGTAFKTENDTNTFVAKDGNTYSITDTKNTDGEITVVVKDVNGNIVSSAEFDNNGDGSYSIKMGGNVKSETKNIGLAKAIYDYVDGNIGKIKKTSTTTFEGDKLWENNSKSENKPVLNEEPQAAEVVNPKKEGSIAEPPTGEGVPKTEAGEEGGKKVGVSHESLTDLAKRLGLKEPETGEWHSPEWYADRGRQLLEAGANPEEVNNTNNELHDRISIARAHLENLVKEADAIAREKGIDSKEYEEAHKKVNDYANDVVKKLGTKAGQAMTALQGERDIDTDSFTAVKKATEDNAGKPVSKEQETKIKDLTEKNQQLKKQADEAEARLVVETEKAFNEGVEKGKQLSKGDKAKKIADKLREKAKLSKPDSFSAATPASLVWDGAVEIVAKGIEAGGKMADAVDAGLKHIRESDWYKSLSDDKKDKAEQDFKQFNNEGSGSIDLEDLQARFLDKKGYKFTVDEAKSIWDYAKETYIDNGVSFRDMIGKVADDLGLTWRQVSEAITSKKTERISDEMWKKRSEQLKSQHATKNWIEAQNKSVPFKALRKVSAAFRGVSVFGHGGIFIGTHAGMTLFNPSQWKVVIPAFIRGWKFAYGNKGKYERRIEQLRNDRNYIKAQRAGLKNNPDNVNTEEFQKSQKFFEKIGGEAGVKGFNAIKVLRQDLFNYHYDRLSEAEKNDPEAVEQIAKLVNNATGATNLKLPEWVNEVTFAGGMEATRWGKLTRNPLRATAIAVKALITPEKATTAEKVFAKVWARRVGEQLGTMAGMLMANAALQNTINPNNPTNLTDPDKPDFMKFKFGDLTIDPSSGMRGTALFMYGLGKIPFMEKKQLRGDSPTKYAGKSIAGYTRGKLAPLYSTMADFFDKQDFNKNPMPFSNNKPGAGHHKLTWGEYAWEKAPLPVAHAATEMYRAALDHNGGTLTHKHVVDGIIAGVLSGGTGFRIGEYNAEEADHSPYTKEDKADPTFKYFLDKGMELPNTSLSSEEVTDEKNRTKKKVSDYSKEIQDKYENTHKQYLKKELSDFKKKGFVYTKEYLTSDGETKVEVYTDKKPHSIKKSLGSLDKDELAQVLRIAQSQATRQTKKKIFNQK